MFNRAEKADGSYDVGELSKGFLYHDDNDPAHNKTAWKFPIADVINGRLTLVYSAAAAAAAALKGGRGGTSVPQSAQSSMKSRLNGVYAKFRSAFKDDTIQSPFK
jgi:hypothetical protein